MEKSIQFSTMYGLCECFCVTFACNISIKNVYGFFIYFMQKYKLMVKEVGCASFFYKRTIALFFERLLYVP